MGRPDGAWTRNSKILDAAAAWHYLPDDETLDKLKATIEAVYAVPPDNTCHWCGKTDTQNEGMGYGPLTDITVQTADGEEGYARETRYACQNHLVEITEKLVEMGFGSHRHGGINFLEDQACPGEKWMADCPTPDKEDY